MINYSAAPQPGGRNEPVEISTPAIETQPSLLPETRVRNKTSTVERVSLAGRTTPEVEAKPVVRKPPISQARPVPAPVQNASPRFGPQPEIPAGSIPQNNPLDIDWATWGLGLLALVAVGGLIPLGIWVYLLYK